MRNKTVSTVVLFLLVVVLFFDIGCSGRQMQPNKRNSNESNKGGVTAVRLTVKSTKDLSKYLQSHISQFQDYSKYIFPKSGIWNGFACYKETAIISSGVEVLPKKNIPSKIKHYSDLYIINTNEKKVVGIIRHNIGKGFLNVSPYGINEDWIVYQENDDRESDPNFAIYALNRKSGKTLTIIERKRGEDNLLTKGEKIPKGITHRIDYPMGILFKNKFYFTIYIYTDVFNKKLGILKDISSSIYEADLNTGNIKRLIHIAGSNGEISSFNVNDNHIAYCYGYRDINKKKLVEDIYLYSFKTGKTVNFTNNGNSETPWLTKDNWITYQVWLPEALSTDPEVTGKAVGKPQFYNVLRPVDKDKPVFKITVGNPDGFVLDGYPTCLKISPSGRYILFDSPYRILDRKTNTITVLKGFPVANLMDFEDDNTLVYVWIINDKAGLFLINIKDLLNEN